MVFLFFVVSRFVSRYTMTKVPASNYTSSSKEKDSKFQVSFDWVCPHCSKPVNFGISYDALSLNSDLAHSGISKCPSCKEKVWLIFLREPFKQGIQFRTGSLFISPDGGVKKPLTRGGGF